MMIREELNIIKDDKKSLRKFGLTVGSVLLLISITLYFLDKNSFVYFGGIGFTLILFGVTLPNVLKPINKIWMTLAIILGWFMSSVILTILFYLTH